MTGLSSPLPENSGTATQPPTRRPVPDRRQPWFSSLLRRLHFYAGILVGPFILIAALSGAVYAISPQIERVVYVDELTASTEGPALPLSDQVESANAYIGEGQTIATVRPAPEPGMTTRVMYEDPTLDSSDYRTIFVDPTTAEVKGDLPVYAASSTLPVRTWISRLHTDLHLGDVGRYYSELAASWMGIIAAAGQCLWIVRARKAKKISSMLKPSRKHKGLRRTLSWHASTGVWIAVGMLFLSATGITWSQLGGGNVGALREALNWTTPSVSTELSEDPGTEADAGGAHAGHGAASGGTEAAPAGTPSPADFDMISSMAENAGFTTSYIEIVPPADADTAWLVERYQHNYPDNTGTVSVAYDMATMAETDRVEFSDYGVAAMLTSVAIDLHMGTLFGLPNQIVLFVLAISIASMVVWGYTMWWQRRPKHDTSRRFGIAPARGALKQAPWWGVALVVLAAVGIGLFLPLVGLSLVAFLVLDVILGLLARRKARAQAGAGKEMAPASRN